MSGNHLDIKTSIIGLFYLLNQPLNSTVKLGDKKQISVTELFTDYKLFYTINLLLDKELLPIKKMPNLGVSELEIVKISKKGGL